jgi:hypothetical protein
MAVLSWRTELMKQAVAFIERWNTVDHVIGTADMRGARPKAVLVVDHELVAPHAAGTGTRDGRRKVHARRLPKLGPDEACSGAAASERGGKTRMAATTLAQRRIGRLGTGAMGVQPRAAL